MGTFYSYNPYIDNYENYLAHYGIKRKSGRYPFGSGKRPHQHEGRKEGLASTLLAVGAGALATAALNKRSEKKKNEKAKIDTKNQESIKITNEVLKKFPKAEIDGNIINIPMGKKDQVAFDIENYEDTNDREKFMKSVDKVINNYSKIKTDAISVIKKAASEREGFEDSPYKLDEGVAWISTDDAAEFSCIMTFDNGYSCVPSAEFSISNLKFDSNYVTFDD